MYTPVYNTPSFWKHVKLPRVESWVIGEENSNVMYKIKSLVIWADFQPLSGSQQQTLLRYLERDGERGIYLY
jgi:hypothetical protein